MIAAASVAINKDKDVDFVPSISVCSQPGALLHITTLSWSPNNITAGASVTVTVDGTLSQTITGGTVSADVKFDGITVLNKQFDLCSLTGVQCPIAAGSIQQTHTLQIPDTLPSGKIEASATATSSSGTQISCVQGSVRIP